MGLKKFGVNEFKKLGKILSHPGALNLIDDFGILEGSPELAMGVNDNSGNLYVGLDCSGLCLVVPITGDEVKLYYYESVIDRDNDPWTAIGRAVKEGMIEKDQILDDLEILKEATKTFFESERVVTSEVSHDDI